MRISLRDPEQNMTSIEKIFLDETTNQTLFNIKQGQTCRCHIVRLHCAIRDDEVDLLSIGDWIIFNFHHVAFDGESERIFLDELHHFYSNPTSEEQTMLQYIDCEFILMHENRCLLTSQ